ncbi:FMN-binding negative transcriptional regulator [Flaviflexus massiliensis]|uniref:FMN-binding negative transcriptional regulator n=1 Tax=Flaviflexus massiliensis TaxID=1522309 RepID=UPI0006D56339|nr:FMN-binding negative transcriptional regulator [Flaviflexus massiliensis]
MIPHYFALDDELAMEFIHEQGAGTLVTARDDGTIDATMLPIIIRDGVIIMHMARFNDHWKASDVPRPGAHVFTGAHGFVSSRDYDLPEGTSVASTWDYTQVTIHGQVTVHDNREWVKEASVDLTRHWDEEEADSMDSKYLDRASKAIIGVSMTIDRIGGKAKLSQNRLPIERDRISTRLREQGTARAKQLADDIDAAPSTARRLPFVGGLHAVRKDEPRLEH